MYDVANWLWQTGIHVEQGEHRLYGVLDLLWHYLETRKAEHSDMQPYIPRKIQKTVDI